MARDNTLPGPNHGLGSDIIGGEMKKRKLAPAPKVHRVPYGTFNDKKQIQTYGEDDRPNPSKPPPAHAPNFPERYFQPDAIYYTDPQDETL